jgi:hypothetical protein
MQNQLRLFVRNLISPKKVRDVGINSCRHYCGFRYGDESVTNPYQDYIVGLYKGIDKPILRERFIHFLSVYRPHNIDEALNIKLSKPYALWIFPWGKYTEKHFNSVSNWVEDPLDVPDIITHYSENGIYQFRIEEEFVWGEKALRSIEKHNYAPNKFNSYIEACKLVDKNGNFCFLILEGNHRLSALFATGQTTFKCDIRLTIYEKDVRQWASVKAGYFSEQDAIDILRAYVGGNTKNYYCENIKQPLKIL